MLSLDVIGLVAEYGLVLFSVSIFIYLGKRAKLVWCVLSDRTKIKLGSFITTNAEGEVFVGDADGICVFAANGSFLRRMSQTSDPMRVGFGHKNSNGTSLRC